MYDVRLGCYRKLNPLEVAGKADSACITPNGQTIWIEFKDERGVQSKEQQNFERQLKQRGAVYLIVRSLEDLCRQLVHLGLKEPAEDLKL